MDTQMHVTEVRRCEFSRIPRNRRHRHDFYEVCLVNSGQGHFVHGDEALSLKPGDLFIADPHVVHEITSLTTRDLDLYFTSFVTATDDHDIHAARIIQDFETGHSVHIADSGYLKPQFDSLYQLQQEPNAINRLYYQDHLLRLLVLQMLEALTLKRKATRTRHTLPRELRRAIEVIEARIDGHIMISEIASFAGTSERTLRRRFQDYFGHTIAQDIRRRRMRKAARLLAQPEWKTAEVGYQLGIDDPAQFTRMFKDVMGVTPRQFRTDKNQVRSRFKDRFMQTDFV